jgi:hypothetical protein
MGSPELDEDKGRRVAAFFVDLMATLTTEEVGDDEVMTLLRSIWSSRISNGSDHHDIAEEDVTAGFVRVAVALAHIIVQERRAAGQLDACVSEVWCDLREFLAAIGDG